MKIIFMGTPDFALSILKKIYESKNHEVLCVVTQPDKFKDRGMKSKDFSPVKKFCLELNNNKLDLLQPDKIKNNKEFINKLREYQADIFVVAAYGKILSQEILDIAKHGCVNIHGSLLPKYRGAAPIQHAIINGETVTGVTIMQMDAGMDTGDIILQKKINIEEQDNFLSLYNKLSDLGGDAILEALDLIKNNNMTRIKQDDSLASYADLINNNTCKIDFNKKSIEIINLIRALDPKPGAFCFYDNKQIKIFKAKTYNLFSSEPPGKIIFIDKKNFAIKTQDGAILILELQEQNSKRMLTQNYLSGHKLSSEILFN
jgi:methionyl-tRNA formyltransferase